MLRWAYTDELELTEDDTFLIDLMKLANRFQLQLLRERSACAEKNDIAFVNFCTAIHSGIKWSPNLGFLFPACALGQMWEGRDVVSQRQKLHSLLPNSWGAERRHPDELLWGDHRQSLGESIHMVCSPLVARWSCNCEDVQASANCVRWILALKLSWKPCLYFVCFVVLNCFG